MSLTYTTLKSQIALYLKRDSLTSYIPSFITMAENELNRRLNVLQREIRRSESLASAARYFTMTDSGAATLAPPVIHSMWRSLTTPANADGGSPLRIKFQTPEQFIDRMTDTVGPPNYYTIEGNANDGTYFARFERPADQSYQIGVIEQYAFDIAIYGSNWLSIRHEEAYLYASLCQAEPFLKNDKRIIVWRTMLEAVIRQIMDADVLARGTQNMTLVSEAAQDLGSTARYNINEG